MKKAKCKALSALIAMLLLIPGVILWAQPRVECRLHTPPPGRLHMTDLWWVDLNNPTRETLNIWLEGHVQKEGREVYFGETWPFKLPPGWKRIQLPDIRIRNQRAAPGYEVFVLRTGSVPPGSYSYWVLVKGEASGGDTAETEVSPTTPPRLVAPVDRSAVTDLYPQFRWAAPIPPVPGVSYELKLVEVLPGQTKFEAMATVRPWFEGRNIRTTAFTYPHSGRPLVPRKKYAWQVRALLDRAVIGVSEIWEFSVLPIIVPPGHGIDIYFCDANETKGSVYHRPAFGPEIKIYTRPSGRIYSFLFAPWDADKLYFLDANQFKIYLKDLSPGAPAESAIYTHTTYVREIEVDREGRLYFSEATGAGGNGKIWRLNSDGTSSLYYTVLLSQVGGFWAGNFCFDREGVLYLSTGNEVGASIYRVDIATNTVTKLWTDPAGSIKGITFGQDGFLYYANWRQMIYALDLETGTRTQVYYNPIRQWTSDVAFKPFVPGVTAPGGVSNWVMPWGVGGTLLPRINSVTGLTSYGDVDSAPFGGHLGFRSGSSIAIPTANLYYYRWEYRPVGGVWQDFDEEVRVYYVKEFPGYLPEFLPFRLGPNDVDGKKLYRFKPHKPPTIPGATTYWPTTPFLGDIYSGYLNTVAKHLPPGKYEIRLSVYDSLGNKKNHGMGFSFVVPLSEGRGGNINTRLPIAGEIAEGGFKFFLHIDNRPCSAYIQPPTIAGAKANDTCGFLRYDPADPSPVHIAFHASHPDGFAYFQFKIVRGTFVTDSSYVFSKFVFANSVGVYDGDLTGNFQHDFLRSTLLGPCHEAAFSELLYVYAKATTGWGIRISSYDASYVRAFALSEKEE